ncbi:MAG: hypothetical protein JO129_00600 [Candidatus Dependentiae bacterium]|nr:hypothetical protein [Candidatus Dependentiae bacterium]
MKKLTLFLLLATTPQIWGMSSTMTHRVMGTSPLLYRMMDYSKQQLCFEVEPIYSKMYDSAHVNEYLILNGKSNLSLNQQGNGDINPTWLNLMSNNTLANYNSTISFDPFLSQAGALLHFYDQYDNYFIDVKTALIECTTQIKLSEVGGGNGLIPGVVNAQQAFTQADWNYGKIGNKSHVVGLDNIEFRVGGVGTARSDASNYNLLFAGFLLVEAPTGSGTKAESLFEAQVGTNHWGVGLGFEALVSGDDDLKFMVAANYRYLTPEWETRSFDLLGNGQWSRYLAVQDTYGLPTAPATLGLPGINYFTQNAYINGRSEFNTYLRLQKHFSSCYFELSYNFFCIQGETIGTIANIEPGYGIYTLTGPAGGAGGVTTSSTATINQDVTTPDSITAPISITTANFNKLSAAASAYATNTLTGRLEVQNEKVIFGFGASIEVAQSKSAISTWSVWAQVGFLFDNKSNCPDRQCPSELSELYDFNTITANIKQQNESDIINTFEFLEDEVAEAEEDAIKILDESLSLAENAILINEINDNIDQALKNIQDQKAAVATTAPADQTPAAPAPVAEEKAVETPVIPAPAAPVVAQEETSPEEKTEEAPVADETAETISLENHKTIPQAENGIALHEAKSMNEKDVSTFLHHDKINNAAMSDADIVTKLNNTK